MASVRPGHSLGEPLTRRRAKSFWGAGRSTEEEGDVNLLQLPSSYQDGSPDP